ncbi:MAG: Formate dehydrogenase, partial [Pseudomonadota bacterium]
MSTVQFTLNGRSVEAAAGKSIFNIAKELGIAIPHLCHKEGLAPDGNCRACMV